jgi:hypothetical protein
MMSSDKSEYEGPAIVELMGHQRIAGFVREVSIAGAGFLRVDVPSDPPTTHYQSPSSLYRLTPTTEDIVRKLAQRWRPEPVSVYDLPRLPARSEDDPADADVVDEDSGF